MMLFVTTEFIGHFHPVLVHLPIGILLLALLLQWLSGKEKYAVLQPAIPIAYLAGSIAAVLSCISGWLLAAAGEYDETTLELHRWMGISIAVIAVTGYYFSYRKNNIFLKWIAVALFILIMIAGHLGGTLTHGEGYLTKAFSADAKDSTVANKAIANTQEAVVFTEIIQPVLQQKCYKCHAQAKQKGGLRLDGKEWLLKGGKDGQVVSAGNPESSELYKRVVLDPLEEKHMPPKGKPQLSEQERVLLHWWIATGLSFDKKSKELEQPTAIKSALTALQKSAVAITKKSAVPDETVEKAPDAALNRLHKAGVTILPVSVNSNYLTANFVNVESPDKQTENLLLSVKKQLIWLKMPGIQLSEISWQKLAECNGLTRLSIEHSNISDGALGYLKSLTHLQYLNLVGTKITLNGLLQLKSLQELTSIYLGQTKMPKNEWIILQNAFPKAIIDSGGYQVSNLATDTQLLKPAVVKK